MRGVEDLALRVLIIDHYDSYTNNILQLLQADGEANSRTWEPVIVRYDQYKWDEFRTSVLPLFDAVVLSPGPGRPDREADFGFNSHLIREGDVPILGICLGHQGIGTSLGAKIIHAPSIKHGQVSQIQHDGSGIFKGLPQILGGVQYNSLVLDSESLPHNLVATAWTHDGKCAKRKILMGVRHRAKPIFGVQWHPESICSTHGQNIMANFRSVAESFWRSRKENVAARITRHSRSNSLRSCIHKVVGQEATITELKPGKGTIKASMKAYYVKTVNLGKGPSPEILFDSLSRSSTDSGEAWLDSAKSRDQRSRYSYLARGVFFFSYSTRLRRIILRRDSQSKAQVSVETSFWSWFDSFQKNVQRETDFDAHEPHGNATLQVGFIGYLGYEMKRESLSGYRWASEASDANAIKPDAQFLFAQNVLRFDHETNNWTLFGLNRRGPSDPIASYLGSATPVVQSEEEFERYIQDVKVVLRESKHAKTDFAELPKFLSNDSMESYKRSIGLVRAAIKEGESYEMTLTTRFNAHLDGKDAFGLYRSLRAKNPAPYSAFINFPTTEVTIMSSSPERFISIDHHGSAEMKPIKGTVAVSKNVEEDTRLKHHLATDVKELAENLMIVDLIRNDLHVISPAASIKVPRLMQVESYETVHQLVTTIQSQVRPEIGSVQAIESVFPPGSMTGAPKLRSVQILDNLERHERGIYSGCLGYFCVSGATDQSVVIRTIVRTGDELSLGAGGAITWLSDADKEWEEVIVKATAVADVDVTQIRADSLEPVDNP